MSTSETDIAFMQRALRLAERGRGFVEPNPMVGCVVVRDDRIIGEGWHHKYGAAHAEVNALADAGNATGTTVFVTLEPCCHVGKTPPCTQALISSNVRRVVIATLDPSGKVSGKGVKCLRDSDVDVEVGVCTKEADRLIAPFRKLAIQEQPWLIAKWAMSLDGKIAARSGDSRWISNEKSRCIVHQMRGQVDAIMIGIGTAQADDPLLTARPSGARVATRIVVDSHAKISESCKLVASISQGPVLIAVGPHADADKISRLRDHGCEVFICSDEDRGNRLSQLFDELGRQSLTNVLCEGGSRLLGSLFDLQMIDEVHAFISPKLIGGDQAFSPLAGDGCLDMSTEKRLDNPTIDALGDDIYVKGFVNYTNTLE